MKHIIIIIALILTIFVEKMKKILMESVIAQTIFIVLLNLFVINAFVGVKKKTTQIIHAMVQMDNVIV
jgi:hypothetical protein